jgi:hypothetical protein
MYVHLPQHTINPCNTCEHGHPGACRECPNVEETTKVKPKPIYFEGKLVIASGEDAHAFA